MDLLREAISHDGAVVDYHVDLGASLLELGDVEAPRGFAQVRRMDGKVKQQQVTFENLADALANWDDDA